VFAEATRIALSMRIVAQMAGAWSAWTIATAKTRNFPFVEKDSAANAKRATHAPAHHVGSKHAAKAPKPATQKEDGATVKA
jgi:hypothetical protein